MAQERQRDETAEGTCPAVSVEIPGAVGSHSGNPALIQAMSRILERLLPVFNEQMAIEGPGAVLNAIQTVFINLSLDYVGSTQTEQALVTMLRILPDVIEKKRLAETPPAGSA